ncbi:hypothetical protein LSPCS325_01240 [Lysinibacillus sp. CTST325]
MEILSVTSMGLSIILAVLSVTLMGLSIILAVLSVTLALNEST